MGEGSGDTNRFSLTSPRHLSTSYPNSASTQQEFQKLHRFYRNSDVCCRIVGSKEHPGSSSRDGSLLFVVAAPGDHIFFLWSSST
jgi:hypothetical protein